MKRMRFPASCPFNGTTIPGYFTPKGEAKRQAVNRWIRTSGAYDAVIEFDAAVRDPSHPTRLLPLMTVGITCTRTTPAIRRWPKLSI